MGVPGGHNDALRGDGYERVAKTDLDWSETAPSTAIVETLASLKDTDPVALVTDEDIVLADYVDPDALDMLLADQRGDVMAVSVGIEEYYFHFQGSTLTAYVPDTEP